MFRWCAYCVTFQGEVAPFDDFSPTHGMCEACSRDETSMSSAALERVAPLIQFHRELLAIAADVSGRAPLPDPRALLERGRSLGSSTIDLAMGVLQPLLYEVGRLWSARKLEPETEARFTSFVEVVLDEVEVEQSTRLDLRDQPPFVFVVAEGNPHTIGIRMAALRLREAGKRAHVFPASQPIDSLLELIDKSKAKSVGISISDKSQLSYAKLVRAKLAEKALPTRLMVGGFGTRNLRPHELDGLEVFDLATLLAS